MQPIDGLKRSILPIMAAFMYVLHLGAATRGIPVTVKTSKGRQIALYKNSYTLVVGNGNYTGGWDPLPGTVEDVKEVATALGKNGFQVTLKTDLTKEAVSRSSAEFAYKHGRSQDNRLLFYYAGHGHTRTMATGEELGYLVMVDAPVPEDDPLDFSLAGVDMQSLVTQAKMIQARHVLFMFDSCFSGSILNLRERVVPRNITESARYPVRQFITNGRVSEPVPDHSVFKQAFLDLLEGRDEEPIPDGYITGEELGLYLKNKVPLYNPSQHPQYGKIRDIHLDKGDFVFVLTRSLGAYVDKPSPQKGGASVSVESDIPGADVFIDGGKVGTTPFSDISIPTGGHIVTMEKPGYASYQKRVDVEPGRPFSLYVHLSPAARMNGRIYVDTKPEDARIRILNIGAKFYQGMKLDEGRYQVEVSADGYETQTMWLKLRSGEDKNVAIKLEPIASTATGRRFTNSLGMEFIYIPLGSFMMGSPTNEKGRQDDEQRHRVTLKKGFYLQSTEVTVGQWRKFVKETGYQTEAETGGGAWVWPGLKAEKKKGTYWDNPGFSQSDRHPVTCVSWNDAQRFIRWVKRKEESNQYRLPTEAEWEYACRVGKQTARFWGEDPNDACRYANVHDQTSKQINKFPWSNHGCDDGYAATAPVGTFNFNSFGLYDILGNVWEWCRDGYGEYPVDSVADPKGSSSSSRRVLRGGSWLFEPKVVRCAIRLRGRPVNSYNYVGFRLLRTDNKN